MQARYEELSLDTQGDGDIIDVTAHAQKAIDNAGVADGLCTVFVAHSTCGIDHHRVRARLHRRPQAPSSTSSRPRTTAGSTTSCNADTNGHSHARAALLGPVGDDPVRRRRAPARRLAEDRLHRLRRPAAHPQGRRPAPRRVAAHAGSTGDRLGRRRRAPRPRRRSAPHHRHSTRSTRSSSSSSSSIVRSPPTL